jgi:hypothetical protein
MEELRCKAAASATEDCHGNNLFNGAITTTVDPRYRNLHHRVEVEVEDSRCNRVAMTMEDPRCQGISSVW